MLKSIDLQNSAKIAATYAITLSKRYDLAGRKKIFYSAFIFDVHDRFVIRFTNG